MILPVAAAVEPREGIDLGVRDVRASKLPRATAVLVSATAAACNDHAVCRNDDSPDWGRARAERLPGKRESLFPSIAKLSIARFVNGLRQWLIHDWPSADDDAVKS